MLCAACNDEFLAVKPDKSYVIPITVANFQALLDNTDIFNVATPALGEISADDYWITEERWNGITHPTQKNGYIWNKDIYGGDPFTNDWNSPYSAVYYANIAIEGLHELEDISTTHAWKNAKGSAHFHRAWAFYQLAQLFCKSYRDDNAAVDLGIPLRRKADINLVTTRTTVAETYHQIKNDLLMAIELLPDTPLVKTRPSKAAAYGVMARFSLLVNDYEAAKNYADSCIQIYPTLLNYQNIDPQPNYPFEIFNQEVIFHSTMLYYSLLIDPRMSIDTTLYNMYHNNDMRKILYYDDNGAFFNFRGSYAGSELLFSGFTSSEAHLIRAEAEARLGDLSAFQKHMKEFLSFRYVGRVPEFPVGDETAMLSFVLAERRKELVMRGVRWSDLRRLNNDSRFAKTLVRQFGDSHFELAPNDVRYVLPIPDAVVRESGILQNDR